VPDRSRRSRALLCALLATFACEVEEASTLEVVVRVESPSQGAASFPAQVLVGFDSGGSGYLVFRVGFLCGPSASPFVTTARFSDPVAGDGPVVVDAWLVPFDGAAFACGPLASPQAVPSRPGTAAGVRRTSANVVILGGCGSGDARSANLVFGSSG
jgi:hypothetical protein